MKQNSKQLMEIFRDVKIIDSGSRDVNALVYAMRWLRSVSSGNIDTSKYAESKAHDAVPMFIPVATLLQDASNQFITHVELVPQRAIVYVSSKPARRLLSIDVASAAAQARRIAVLEHSRNGRIAIALASAVITDSVQVVAVGGQHYSGTPYAVRAAFNELKNRLDQTVDIFGTVWDHLRGSALASIHDSVKTADERDMLTVGNVRSLSAVMQYMSPWTISDVAAYAQAVMANQLIDNRTVNIGFVQATSGIIVPDHIMKQYELSSGLDDVMNYAIF